MSGYNTNPRYKLGLDILAVQDQPHIRAVRCEIVNAQCTALSITLNSGRVGGPEFDRVTALIRARDELIREALNVTDECVGQLMGGN